VLGRKQEVMLGADYQKDSNPLGMLLSSNSAGLPLVNPYAFDPGLYPAPDFSPANLTTTIGSALSITQWGVYGAARIRPIENLALIGGVRLSDFRSDQSYNLGSGTPTLINNYKESGKLTPYAGVTYDLGAHYTWYASYADIYHTNGGELSSSYRQLHPSDGVNEETGLKGAWFANKLNASLALFEVKQTGLGVPDPRITPTINCCFLTASVSSKGFEAELTGSVTDRWQLTLGYTYDDHVEVGPYFITELPRHLIKAWTNYELPFDARRWSVGGGVRAQSVNQQNECVGYNADGSCAQFVGFHQGFYAIADLRAAYAFSKNWSLALNVNNLFDRVYYQTLGQLAFDNWYGSPRNFMLKVEGKL